jgi:hypothetical protein
MLVTSYLVWGLFPFPFSLSLLNHPPLAHTIPHYLFSPLPPSLSLSLSLSLYFPLELALFVSPSPFSSLSSRLLSPFSFSFVSKVYGPNIVFVYQAVSVIPFRRRTSSAVRTPYLCVNFRLYLLSCKPSAERLRNFSSLFVSFRSFVLV